MTLCLLASTLINNGLRDLFNAMDFALLCFLEVILQLKHGSHGGVLKCGLILLSVESFIERARYIVLSILAPAGGMSRDSQNSNISFTNSVLTVTLHVTELT